MNTAINDFIDAINLDWQADICRKLDQLVCESIPTVEGRIQYRKPHYLKNGKYAAAITTAKGWVSFTIFNANALALPAGVFEASDNQDRITVKITSGQAVDYGLLAALLKQASDTI